MHKIVIILFFLNIQLFSHNITPTTFNPKEYLQTTSFTNIKKHQEYREKLPLKERDLFLYQLTDYFLNTSSISMSNIEERIAIGEKFLKFYEHQTNKNDKVYQIIAYYILGKCAYVVEKDFKDTSSVFGPSDRLRRLKKRLEKLKIYLKIKNNDTRKLLKYIRNGNFSYIQFRFCTKFCPPDRTENNQTIHIKPLFKKDPTLFSLFQEEHKVGELLWLKKEKYRVNYLAGNEVDVRYKNYLQQNHLKIKAVMTGAFTNMNDQIEGLTLEKGNIVNAVLMPHRDALVFIESNDTIHVLNLQDPNLLLPKTKNVIHPLENVRDYAKLLQWARENNATVFQTQLLAYENKTLIHRSSIKSKIRERRLLVLVDNNNGGYDHLIVNITKAIDLANITQRIIELLNIQHHKVYAVLNLDVGGFNIFNVYYHNKKILTTPIAFSEATNLIFYTEKEIDSQ